MSDPVNYKNAYLRQKAAREKAEFLLENRARELFESNESLRGALVSLENQKAHLVQQEKLASIGLLAAGIAHEINNPLAFVKSNLQILQETVPLIAVPLQTISAVLPELMGASLSEETREKLLQVSEKIENEDLDYLCSDSLESIKEGLAGLARVEDILKNLNEFSHSESDKRTLLDINEVLEETLKLISNELKYSCEVVKKLGDLPKIYGSMGQFGQIFINLAINAAQAMEKKGILEVRTYHEKDCVFIEFTDSGPGIPADNLAKLFDPFYTTKEIGVGTGLGLYVSHGIATKHHGSIKAENVPEGGARFTVTLPIDVRSIR